MSKRPNTADGSGPPQEDAKDSTTSEEGVADKEKDPANMGGIGRLGRHHPRRHRDIETVLDWTNRAELWSYITERNGDGTLPTTIRDNVKPEVLQRMAARCALEEMRERVEGKNDQIDRQNDIIEHYQKQVRQL